MSDFVRTVEGRTIFLVPQSSLTQKVPPKTPAFFNPAAKLNRDLSVLAYRAYLPFLSRKTLADSFTGIGARALRIAVEVPEVEHIYGNDINSIAIETAKKAAKINSVDNKCHFSINEVCKFRYYGRPLNNSYGNETAIRLLLSLIALTASRLELSIKPLFVHDTMHYLRVYASIFVSSKEANNVYNNIGYITHCFQCGHRFKGRNTAVQNADCAGA